MLQLGLLIGAPVAVYAIGGFENIFFGIVLTIVVFVAGGAALAEAAMWFEVVVYAAAAIWANRTARTIAMIVAALVVYGWMGQQADHNAADTRINTERVMIAKDGAATLLEVSRRSSRPGPSARATRRPPATASSPTPRSTPTTSARCSRPCSARS